MGSVPVLKPQEVIQILHKGELIGIEILRASAFEEEGGWIGWLDKYPDQWTQGDSLADLKEHLKDLHADLASAKIPGYPRERSEGG